VLKAAFQGSGCFQNQLVLLIKNPHDVGDLAGCEILLPEVDVLACAFRRFCSGFPQSPKTLFKNFTKFRISTAKDTDRSTSLFEDFSIMSYSFQLLI